MADEKPYWWPELVDEEFFARLRSDYPDRAHMDDDELREEFECYGKYSDCWDHAGDARADWEGLADAFLALRTAHEALEGERDRLRDAAMYVILGLSPSGITDSLVSNNRVVVLSKALQASAARQSDGKGDADS